MDYDTVVDMNGLQSFKDNMMTAEPVKNVTLVSLLIITIRPRASPRAHLLAYLTS